MSRPELDSLIVQHLADLDRTTLRIAQLQGELFEAMKRAVERWCEENGWRADFSYDQGGHWPDEPWLAPLEWRTAGSDDEGDFDAWFQLDVGEKDTEAWVEGEDFWFITRLCRAGVGQTGFRFKTGLKKGRAWKQAFARIEPLVKETSFHADSTPSLFLPFALDPVALSRAIEQENLDLALGPLMDALRELARTKAAFTEAIRRLRPESA
jgi:hypothetical protein